MMLKAIVGAVVVVAIGVIAIKCYKETIHEKTKSKEKEKEEDNLYKVDSERSCCNCKHCTCKENKNKDEEPEIKEDYKKEMQPLDDFQGCGDCGNEIDEGVKDILDITDEISSVTESEVKEDQIDELKL